MDAPEGFEPVEAEVWGKGDVVVVSGRFPDGREFSFVARLGPPTAESPEEDAASWGPPPDGYEWTGEVRPPKRGELFWSDLKGQVVRAVEDETGFNRFGEPTGGRRILRPLEPEPAPTRPTLRLVR